MRLPILATVLLASSIGHAGDKFTHTSDVKPTVTLTERSKAPPKKDAPGGPSLAAQILEVQGLLGTIHAEQIDILENDLIAKTPDDQVVEKADYLFRLGEIYAKLHRFHRLKGVENEIALRQTKDAKKRAALTAAIAQHEKDGHRALMGAIRTYQMLVDNPKFANAPRVDVALFYFAYTLQNAGYAKEARATYDKLLKNYPKSKYVPEAHLAFAEFHFEARQLADAEARYKKVLQSPGSSVYRYAQYKLGWVDYNLGKFAEAMQAFNDVIQGTRDPKDQVLHRSARKDFVRAYAEIGKADKALLTFKRVGGGDGIDMLQALADHYLDQGKSEKAIYVLRELMTAQPTSKNVCVWEHNVARAMLTVPSATADDKVGEIEKLVKLYSALKGKTVLPKAEAIECREAAAEMSGQLARAYHQEGAKTKNSELLRLAGRLYRAYLGGFKDAKDYAETEYFHAELAWLFAELETDKRLATQKWEDASKAFTAVVEGGRLQPRLVQVSADAAMLAAMKALHVDPRVRQQPVDDKAYETVAVPKPLPAQEAKLLAAYDGYLKHVKDPNDEERIDVMFHRANLLRRYDHHAEALPALEQIAMKHPKHEAAPWAAQLVLDSYNRLKNYDAMFAFADRLPQKFLDQHEALKTTVGGLKIQWLEKQAEQLQEVAKKTGDISKYVECGGKYLEAYNRDPLAGNADKILYNAGVCYEQGKSLSAAMSMYGLLQQHFPKSKLTARSLARLGNVYASIAFYKQAAEKLEEYATKYAGETDAFSTLSDAVQFRKGIGDDAKALADTMQFVKMFGKTKPQAAATAFFSMTSIYEKQGDKDKLAAHLRTYLAQHGAAGGADRRVIANAKLGQTLWLASCPVPTVDGTCMKMTRVASTARKLRATTDAIPKRCGDETQAEIQMIPRDEAKVKAAMAAFANAIAEYERAGGKLEGDTRGALYHYALARFGKTERQYEQFLTMQIPAGLKFDRRNPAIADQSLKRFTTWFNGKGELAAALRKEYDAIIALKDGAIAIAAAARVGATTANFSAQLYRAEIPLDQRTGPYAEDTALAYCDQLEKLAEPLQRTAENAYEGCLATSTRLGWFSEWSRACERELGQLKPEQYPKAFELRRQPTGYATIVDIEKPTAL